MTGNSLRNLREWLTIDQAAELLSVHLGERCSPADILRLGIDGQLILSLYLPTEVIALCEPREGAAASERRSRRIQGLCDIPMDGRARLQIEHEYQWREAHRYVPIDGPIGAIVGYEDMLCTLPPDRGATGMSPRSKSEFPEAAVLCVRTSVLESFAQAHVAARHPAPAKQSDKPLGTRERATLLTIIAALAKEADIDVTQPSKASTTIEALTQGLGTRVAARTIEDHLKRIPDALERRSE
jgi:hypothetical protein